MNGSACEMQALLYDHQRPDSFRLYTCTHQESLNMLKSAYCT
jgi:hypothetical protein